MLAKGSLTLRGWSPEKPAGQMSLLESAKHPHKPFKLGTQLDRVHKAMMGGEWMTLAGISAKSGVPLSTVGSRIRDLRKPKGHEHTICVEEHVRVQHLYVYRMGEKNV